MLRLRSGPVIELGDIFSSDFAITMEMFDQDMYGLRTTVLPANPIIVDVGANIGLFSVAAHLQFPDARIIAYEPHPRNFALLTKNAPFATLVEKAITDHDGVVQIQTEGKPGEFSLVADDGIPVPAVSLDHALADVGRVDLIKVDVEGSERPIFEAASAATLAKIRRAVVEVSDGQEAWFESFFARANFSYAWTSHHIFTAWQPD